MQVADDGGYIDIEPVGGLMYVPVYDPYVVFARPRPGFFVGGAIRFGGGFHWVSGYNRFNWRSHEVVVNRRVWTPPVRRTYVPPQRRFDDNRRNFTGGSHAWNRSDTRSGQCSLLRSGVSFRSSRVAIAGSGTS